MTRKAGLLMLLCSASLLPLAVHAQPISPNAQYTLEAGGFAASAGTNPFWVRSNQYGEVPLAASGFTIRGQVKKEYSSSKNRKISYGYGARAVINAGATNEFLLTEAYGKFRYGAFELYSGRRREIQGLVDTTLTTGSYIWSGNARPMPKIQVSIPTYTPILKNGLIAVKGNFAHGWFGNGDSITNAYLHQKSLYVRLGKPDWRFKVHAGFNHQVQWGGGLNYLRVDRGVKITNYGTDLQSFIYVVSGRSLYSDDTLVVQNNAASAEGGNRVGNHLGTIDLGIEYEDEQNRWFFYRQNIYEAGALFYLSNIADGLTGISFTRKNNRQGIQHVVLEYLHTSDQGGPYASGRSRGVPQLRGYEDYFNNGRYLDGWTYMNQTIGTPFIMPLQYSTGIPQKLANNPHYILNNRVNTLTLSVKSRYKLVDLVTRLSFSNNLGNYDTPLAYTQLSVQQQVLVPIEKYLVKATIGYDTGGVLKENIGTSLLIARTF